MKNGNGFEKRNVVVRSGNSLADISLHPAWLAFIRYCRELQHGEIELLKILDGLPVLAEVTTKKVKFGS